MFTKIEGKEAFVLVYLDDFGGAEKADKAHVSFNHLGWLLEYFGLEEAPEKSVAPTTKMDWLGITFDTIELPGREYIPSKENCLADLCSRAFSNEGHFNNFNRMLLDGVLRL